MTVADDVLARYADLAAAGHAEATALAAHYERAGMARHQQEVAYVAWRLERVADAARRGATDELARDSPSNLTRGLESDHGDESDPLYDRLSEILRYWKDHVARAVGAT